MQTLFGYGPEVAANRVEARKGSKSPKSPREKGLRLAGDCYGYLIVSDLDPRRAEPSAPRARFIEFTFSRAVVFEIKSEWRAR